MREILRSQEENRRGYVLIHRDWYELPDEPDMLRRNVIVLTLNDAFEPRTDAQIVKRGYEVLEPIPELPFAYTICDLRPVPHGSFDSLDDARQFLREHGVKHPRLGFNPIG